MTFAFIFPDRYAARNDDRSQRRITLCHILFNATFSFCMLQGNYSRSPLLSFFFAFPLISLCSEGIVLSKWAVFIS